MNDSQDISDQASVRLENAVEAYRKQLHDLITQQPETFARLVCEGVMATPGSQVPFSTEDPLSRARQTYGYLASLIIRKMDRGQTSEVQSEYLSLSDWVEDHTYFDNRFFRVDDYTRDPSLDHIRHEFFAVYRDGLAAMFAVMTEYLYHGVPLYIKDEHGSYSMVEYDDEQYVYMRQRGKRWDVTPDFELPDFASRFYIKPEHIRWHDIFFSGDDSLKESEIEERREALIMQLNIPPRTLISSRQSVTFPSSDSPTLNRLHRAIADFPATYPECKTRSPKLDDDIRPWLKSAGYAKNDREAFVFGSIIAEHFEL